MVIALMWLGAALVWGCVWQAQRYLRQIRKERQDAAERLRQAQETLDEVEDFATRVERNRASLH